MVLDSRRLGTNLYSKDAASKRNSEEGNAASCRYCVLHAFFNGRVVSMVQYLLAGETSHCLL